MASGQTLILTQAPFSSKGLVMSRKVPGPHIAFYVPAAKWSAALAQLEQLGIANGDRGAAKERHDGQGGTYMDDPGRLRDPIHYRRHGVSLLPMNDQAKARALARNFRRSQRRDRARG